MRARIIVLALVVFGLSFGAAKLWRRGQSKPSEASGQTVAVAEPAADQPKEATAQASEQAAARPARQDFPVERGTSRFDLKGAKRLEIENPYGHVVLAPGQAEVVVERVVNARGQNAQEAKGKVKGFRVTGKQDKERGFLVEVAGDPKNLEVAVNLTVSVPAGVAVRARSGEGSVVVGDLQGSVQAEGAGGDITVGNVKGKVTVSTAYGNIEVKGAGGGLEAQTSSGNLDLKNIKGGSVIARSMGGAIALRVIKAEKLIVNTMSGPVDLSVSQPFSGEGEVRSSSGDLLVSLPANSNCTVRTATGSGPIKCSLPLKEEKHQGTNISGRLGAGKGTFLVTNDSGGIELRPTE